jgi:hypothetical protein
MRGHSIARRTFAALAAFVARSKAPAALAQGTSRLRDWRSRLGRDCCAGEPRRDRLTLTYCAERRATAVFLHHSLSRVPGASSRMMHTCLAGVGEPTWSILQIINADDNWHEQCARWLEDVPLPCLHASRQRSHRLGPAIRDGKTGRVMVA